MNIKEHLPIRKIRAKHKFTGETLILYYGSLTEAMRRNKGLTDFEYIGAK